MSRIISAVILITVLCHLDISIGYKWVPLQAGVPFPKFTVLLNADKKSYVGRAVHYNSVQPAEVFNSSYGVIFTGSEKTPNITKKQFEVLVVSQEECKWEEYHYFDAPENVVHAGRAWNYEPIYLGKANEKNSKIASILLTSNKFEPDQYYKFVLTCANNAIWVDATPSKIPKNAVIINKRNTLSKSFVARLLGPASYIPARLSTELNACVSRYNGTEIYSSTCQVLVGKPNQYSWKAPEKFERIPDNAVVVGKTKSNEFIYVARDSFDSLRNIIFSEIVNSKVYYEFLVKN